MDFVRAAPQSVTATLSYSESVVLFELLHRWEDEGGMERLTQDPGELRLLWDLSAALEPIIDEVFGNNYEQVVRDAWAEVAGDG